MTARPDVNSRLHGYFRPVCEGGQIKDHRGVRVLAGLLLGSIGFFAVTVGVHDALAAFEVASRFGGAMLLVGGSALIVVSIALFFPSQRWAATVGVYLATIGALVGISLIAAQLLSPDRDFAPLLSSVAIALGLVFFAWVFNLGPFPLLGLAAIALVVSYLLWLSQPDHDERLVIWAAIVIAAGLAAFALWGARPSALSADALKALYGVVGFATLGALISGAQLWYSTQYLPSHQKPSLTVESDLSQRANANGLEVAELTFAIANTGEVKADILGSVYRVTAAKVAFGDPDEAAFARQLKRPHVKSRPVLRYRRAPRWDVVQADRIFVDDSWLSPGEKFSTKALVYVPPDRYDVLRVQANILIAKGDTIDIDFGERELIPFSAEPGRPFWGVSSTLPIEETSMFRELTRANRELLVTWVAGRRSKPDLPHLPDVGVAVVRSGEARTPAAFEDYNGQLAEVYGLSSAVSTTETPLRHR